MLRHTADAFVSTGLAALGYTYVNVDGEWRKGMHLLSTYVSPTEGLTTQTQPTLSGQRPSRPIPRLGLHCHHPRIPLELDCWQVDRAPTGEILADTTRFPRGMASVASYVRSVGLKFGLYTAQREFTCQQRPGSWRFEDIDIDTYCKWGVEYVKTDGAWV